MRLSVKTSFRRFFYRTTGIISFFILLLSGCAPDTYQRRADAMKNHVESFYTHLQAHRVGAAVHENEQIEAMADQMAETVRKQGRLQGTSQVEREFALMKTARGTAAQNWIALGQYFAIKQQPERARASYQRVLDTYTDPTERDYREQAA
jgi:PBP1b-binding outer membrane lipoprotein LpoB